MANSSMIAVEIELIQSQHDILLSVARRLNQENVLKKPTIEDLMLTTLRILIKEYQEDPQSVTTYFQKRNSLNSWGRCDKRIRKEYWIISFRDIPYKSCEFLSFLRFLAPLYIHLLPIWPVQEEFPHRKSSESNIDKISYSFKTYFPFYYQLSELRTVRCHLSFLYKDSKLSRSCNLKYSKRNWVTWVCCF